jgi:predicted lipid-binding transport protein (Tim44 family)
MRKILTHFLIIFLTCGFFIHTAEAKRFGGGKSFGYQRSFSNSQHASRNTSSPAAAPASSTRNKWLAPLAGLAAGGLLASLFMGHGLGSGILSWIMILAGAFFLWRIISKFRSNARPQAMHRTFQTEPAVAPSPSSQIYDTSYTPKENNASFNEADFLRTAKTIFIRLQNAYDHKNLNDIREFTAPEVFAEIQMQIQERGDSTNQTDILQIDAKLVDLQIETDKLIASVEFSGQIREEKDAGTVQIKETWHFDQIKPLESWRVLGIQQ